MSDVQLFSNKPLFCQKNLSVQETLNLSHFNALTESNPATSSYGRCDNALMGTLLQKNIVHQLIRCGGEDIDVTWMEDMYPATNPTMVTSTTWYNRYMCDPDFNIYAANTVTGTAPGASIVITILKSNHGSNGTMTEAAVGYMFLDKSNMIWYTITAIDTTTPYAHRITLTPNDTLVTAQVKINKQYLIIPARMIGGCSCPIITNSLASLGYVQQLHPVRIRRDWRLCLEILRGYTDDIRYTVTYDMQGKPVDSWWVKQEQDMRSGIKMLTNLLAFAGSPTTNAALISGGGATIDGVHTGFYGMVPTIQYGGGKVYDMEKGRGFDWEADFEPIMLYQGSRKLSRDFTGLAGMKFLMDITDRSSKVVKREGLGLNEYDAFRRKDGMDADGNTGLQKLGIRSYSYAGFNVNLKEMKSWSDYRFFGDDRWNSTCILMPHQGVTENGKKIPPMEFYNYGNGQWTGGYEEHYIDYRDVNGCDDIGGYGAQSLGFGMHCPDQWILVNPVDPT